MNRYKFAILGGDMRQVKLAELIKSDGHQVSTFAMEKVEPKEIGHTETLKEAVEKADCIVLPLPVTSKDNNILNSPLSEGVYKLDQIFDSLEPGQLITGGRVDCDLLEGASRRGLPFFDYYAREELIIAGAIATAEGAIQIAMEETPFTIFESRCLVLGFGRIGKVLSHRLKGLGANVTVSARNLKDHAWIEAYGYGFRANSSLNDGLGDFDIIFNTVPATILDKKRLSTVQESCLLIDLASKPGGMDFLEASKLGLQAIWALSLPGEVAPVTSGVIMKQTIYNILREQGRSI